MKVIVGLKTKRSKKLLAPTGCLKCPTVIAIKTFFEYGPEYFYNFV